MKTCTKAADKISWQIEFVYNETVQNALRQRKN